MWSLFLKWIPFPGDRSPLLRSCIRSLQNLGVPHCASFSAQKWEACPMSNRWEEGSKGPWGPWADRLQLLSSVERGRPEQVQAAARLHQRSVVPASSPVGARHFRS